MEPPVEERFEEIRALLRAGAERANEMDIRFNERMDRAARESKAAAERAGREHQEAMQRMDREHQEAMERIEREHQKEMQRIDRRMEAFDRRQERWERRQVVYDRRLEATRKLVEAGIKMVVDMRRSHKALEASQKAFLDSLRRGGNGNGHRR